MAFIKPLLFKSLSPSYRIITSVNRIKYSKCLYVSLFHTKSKPRTFVEKQVDESIHLTKINRNFSCKDFHQQSSVGTSDVVDEDHINDVTQSEPFTMVEKQVDEPIYLTNQVVEPIYLTNQVVEPIYLTNQGEIETDKRPSVFDTPVNKYTVDNYRPEIRPAFNFASYVNMSDCLSELVKLEVDLSEWEKMDGVLQFALGLNFERDVKNHILFLNDNGVPADAIGKFLTKCPEFLQNPLELSESLIIYLKSKNFTSRMIGSILTTCPRFINYRTKEIDRLLGYYQKKFSLTGDEIRELTVRCPRLIVFKPLQSFMKLYFVMHGEMGFSEDEVKKLLLIQPEIFLLSEANLMEKFRVITVLMKLPRNTILNFPAILNRSADSTNTRHNFLKRLGRDQYDPLQPNYVPVNDLILMNNQEFCIHLAKTSLMDYDNFLKTL